jgi:hypothetical protein
LRRVQVGHPIADRPIGAGAATTAASANRSTGA